MIIDGITNATGDGLLDNLIEANDLSGFEYNRIGHDYAQTSTTIDTISAGNMAKVQVAMGNSSGNYVFQEWFVVRGYTGTAKTAAKKIVEHETATTAPNVTINISSSGVITSSVSNGSAFSGYYTIIKL